MRPRDVTGSEVQERSHGVGSATVTDSSESSTISRRPLVFAEELHVLLQDRRQGGLVDIDDRNMRHAFAGAVLMDLAKEHRIDTDLERLMLVDPTPLGDDILDPLLAVISKADDGADTVYWIKRFSAPEIANQIRRRAAERLIGRGIFYSDPGGAVYLDKQVSLTGRYPGVPLPEGQDVVLRVMNVIFSEDIPTPDETMLIALVDACRLFERLLTKLELAGARERIALLGGLDLTGLAVRNAILTVREPEDEGQSLRRAFLAGLPGTSRKRPPMVSGALPWIGHSHRLRPMPSKTLADYYRTLGPVFRVRDLGHELTVLAGPEANRFCQKHGRSLFRTHDTYTPLFEGMDAQRTVLSTDGEEHFQIRRAISSSLSRDRYLSMLPEIRDIILRELPENRSTVATKSFSQLTAKAIGLAYTGYVMSSSQVDSMDFFVNRLFVATLLRILPRSMAGTRRMRRAKARFFDVFARMLSTRLDSGRLYGDGDTMDALLELHRSNPQLMPEHELRVHCLGPIFAGMHTTASTGTFAMYLLLKHPDVLRRVRAEADMLYADGKPNPTKLNALDVTRRAALETLRMYNPFNVILRRSINTFRFGGYTIPVGTRLFLPTAVPHYCPEFFPEPDRFDIDRYLPNRAEHRQAGVYMPFGFGTHRCLGAHVADVHLMFSLATILRHFDVRMDPSNYTMKIILAGVPAPTKRFKLKLTRRQPNAGRNPTEAT